MTQSNEPCALDWVIANIFGFLIAIPLVLTFGTDHIRFGMNLFNSKNCQLVSHVTPELTTLTKRDYAVFALECERFPFDFISDGRTIRILFNREIIVTEIDIRWIEQPIDENGGPIKPLITTYFILPILLTFGLAVIASRNGGSTWGKSAFGLGYTPVDRKRLVKREALKWAPILTVYNVTTDRFFAIDNHTALELFLSPTNLAASVFTAIALTWYYLVPFFTKDRRQHCDRWSGCQIEPR
jgi:hypothetical protein